MINKDQPIRDPQESIPAGTQIRITQRFHHADPSYRTETVGVLQSWDHGPSGASFAHSTDGRYWLQRATIRKPDGEMSTLNLDRYTDIQPIDEHSDQTNSPKANESNHQAWAGER